MRIFAIILTPIFTAGLLVSCSQSTSSPYAIKPVLGADSTDSALIRESIKFAHEWADSLKDEKINDRLNKSPEMFAWLDFKFMQLLLDAYEYTGHPDHLRKFSKTADRYLARMTAGPDGYKGWYGPHIPGRRGAEEPLRKIDEIQMNFRAMDILARWARLAAADTRLEPEYKNRISNVLDICERHIFDKFDARSRYVDLGTGKGGVYRFGAREKANNLTLPFEKHSIMFEGIMELYRATENERYLRRAADIGLRYKRALSLKNDAYGWHYWEPTTRDDADFTHNKWRHWVNPEPQGGWHNVSSSMATTLYQYGLVFDDTDIERFVKTQKEICWDGNLENPGYFVTSGDTIPTQFVKKSAILSYGISLFDTTLRELAFGKHAQARAAVPKKKPGIWASGIGIRGYLAGKYLNLPAVQQDMQPYRTDKTAAVAGLYTYAVVGAGTMTPAAPNEVTIWPR